MTTYNCCRVLGFFLLFVATTAYVWLPEDNPLRCYCGCFYITGFLIFHQRRYLVKKESVIIMPSSGIQLETEYFSGKVVSRFIPIGNILKPALREWVTPYTRYRSLWLFLHGEEPLTLVFKELRPPLEMLIPIWKALCNVTGTDPSEIFAEEELWEH